MGANLIVTRLVDALVEDEVGRQSRNFFKGKVLGASCLNSCDHGTYFTGGGVPAHVHQETEEIFYFIRGEGVVILGDKEVSVRAGSVVSVPVGMVHGVRNTGADILQHVVCSARTKVQ